MEHYTRAMTGSEIARELNITRQAVSQTLKRAMGKLYRGIMEREFVDSPTEAVLFLQKWLQVVDEEDIQQFFELFPVDIQQEIKADAIAQYRSTSEDEDEGTD